MRSGDVIAERYRLVELIGSGGMGIVWLADDLVEQHQVALKRPHETTGNVIDDLQREADIARRVAHPNAVRVVEVVGDGWLVMEYFPADSLARLLDQRLEPHRVAVVGAQIASALAAAHAAQVVHRDVTPGNVLIGRDGTAKLTDYGISAWRAATITSSGKISGTAAYVSPEVADGEGAKAASDVFSLGATLFAAVEGTPPFGSGDPDAVLARIREGRGEPFRHAGPLAPVLAALMQRDRAARPSAEQARELLEAVADGRPLPDWVPAAPRARRRWPVVVGAAAAVVAIAVVAVLRPWEDEPAGPARTALGDPRTADPCALADPEPLNRYGDTSVDPHYGGLNRCDVLIDVGEDDEIDVLYQLDTPDDGDPVPEPPATVDQGAPEPDGGDCSVTLTLTDNGEVVVDVRPDDGVAVDPCEVATVAADNVESALRAHGELPRRPEPDPRSLAGQDACTMLTPADLSAVSGFADADPEAGFGDWACRWTNADDTGSVQVLFDQGNRDSVSEGTHLRLADRDVYVEPDGYGEETCSARVFNLTVADDAVETVMVVAEGEVPRCEIVTALAEPVAAKLPL